MKMLLTAALLFAVSSLTYAQSDTDADNPGQWGYGRAGTDRCLDNESQWNSDGPRTVGERCNDGQWNLNLGGTDSNLDNSDQWESSRATPIKFSIMAVSGIPTMMVKIGI